MFFGVTFSRKNFLVGRFCLENKRAFKFVQHIIYLKASENVISIGYFLGDWKVSSSCLSQAFALNNFRSILFALGCVSE